MTKDESNDEPAKATRSGLTSTEEQIIALLRNQGLDNARTVNASAGAEEETNARHLFWDTQVSMNLHTSFQVLVGLYIL
jgi:hypothetical protein